MERRNGGRRTLAMFALIGSLGASQARPAAPRLEIVSGANQSDSIGAIPAQGLVVRVLDDRGAAEPGVEVNFASIPGPCRDIPASFCHAVQLAAASSSDFASAKGVVTDARGRATVRIRMGTVAGEGRVAINVPVYGLTDTAEFRVAPGAVLTLSVQPRDTIVVVGSTVRLRASAADRAGNPVSGQPAFQATRPAVSVGSTGVVSARESGRGWVRVRMGRGLDSVPVNVVPNLEILYSASQGYLRFGTLMGTDERTILTSGIRIGSWSAQGSRRDTLSAAAGIAEAPSWSPRGDSVVFIGWTSTLTLTVMDTLAQSKRLTAAPNRSNRPQWSRDGWIYSYAMDDSLVYRIRPDGSEMTELAKGWYVTPSPDGRRVAYVSGAIRVLDMQSKATTTLQGTEGAEALLWSSDGEWIAFWKSQMVWLIHPDGSGTRSLGSLINSGVFSWSTDSRWLLATAWSADRPPVQMFEVATGERVNTRVGTGTVSWRPTTIPEARPRP